MIKEPSLQENQPVPPRPAPDPDDPVGRDTREFMASPQICWPESEIKRLLGVTEEKDVLRKG